MWNIILPQYLIAGVIYGGRTGDVMIVINLNHRERKRPTADLCSAYGCGILFSLHQISPLSPESAHLAHTPRLPLNYPHPFRSSLPQHKCPVSTQNTDAPFTSRAGGGGTLVSAWNRIQIVDIVWQEAGNSRADLVVAIAFAEMKLLRASDGQTKETLGAGELGRQRQFWVILILVN